MREKSEHAQPVVDGNDDRTLAGQHFTVIGARAGKAAGKSAAVDPYHNGQPVFGGLGGRPDVEIKAVFTQRRELGLINSGSRWIRRLPAGIRELRSLANSLPCSGRLRRFPAQIAYGRGGKGNPAEYFHVR